MNMKKTVFILILIAVIGCRQQQKTLKLAHGLDIGHSVHKAMVLMANEVEKKSSRKLKIDIYPSGQLGAERECLELLQISSLDMTKVSAAVMEGFVEEYKVFGIPYLFRDKEHYYTILDGETGKDILEKGEEYRLRGLCYYDAGSRSFYTIDRPVNHPDDLKGLKIRVMKSITAVKMVQSPGGSPTQFATAGYSNWRDYLRYIYSNLSFCCCSPLLPYISFPVQRNKMEGYTGANSKNMHHYFNSTFACGYFNRVVVDNVLREYPAECKFRFN